MGELLLPVLTNLEAEPFSAMTPDAYVDGLLAHAEAIPDLSNVLHYDNFSEAEHGRLARYSCRSDAQAIRSEGIAPLYRDDIIDPTFCDSSDDLRAEATGVPQEYRRQSYEVLGISPHETYAARKWNIAYIVYMRARRLFHAAFMQALYKQQPVADLVETIGTHDGRPLEVPFSESAVIREGPAPAALCNRTNWLAASLLSVLALPPKVCDASMKRHAVEQWAEQGDPDDAAALMDFWLEGVKGPVRLPWSMRAGPDLETSYHPKWRHSPPLERYLGKPSGFQPEGFEIILQEAPKDYLQLLILQIFKGGTLAERLKKLAYAAELAPQIKEIIFAEDAAHNTVYSNRPVFPRPNTPMTLLEHLADGSDQTEATKDEIIEAQFLQIRSLKDQLDELRRADAELKLGLAVLVERVARLEGNF